MRQALRILVAALVMAIGVVAVASLAARSEEKAHSTRFPKMGLFAQLRGSHEVSVNGGKRSGDLGGRGSFAALIHGKQKFCFGITVTGINTPTAAHIHRGRRGKNGPIIITLTAPSGGDPGASSGCLDADLNLLADIRKRPSRYYANVHTANFPGGAIRGQLFHPNQRQDR